MPRELLILGRPSKGTVEIVAGPERPINEVSKLWSEIRHAVPDRYATLELWDSEKGRDGIAFYRPPALPEPPAEQPANDPTEQPPEQPTAKAKPRK